MRRGASEAADTGAILQEGVSLPFAGGAVSGTGHSEEGSRSGRYRRHVRAMWPIATMANDGAVRSFHVPKIKAKDIHQIIKAHVATDTRLMTDEAKVYKKIGRSFQSHESVNHSKLEYARGEVHTNTIEGFFSLFKRGVIGIYHHVSGQHLQRYYNEFDFRYSNRKITDTERADYALRGISGKRLLYRDS